MHVDHVRPGTIHHRVVGSNKELISVTAEREEQNRSSEEARLRRQEQKKEETRRVEEAARRRQQTQHSQQSALRQTDQTGSGAGQQRQGRHSDQRGPGTVG